MSEPEYLSSTRDVYDNSVARFVDAIGTEVNPQFEAPLDRAVLASFIEHVVAKEPGLVLDAGCGPGRIAAFLAARGLDVHGIDLAPGMVAAARQAHPHIDFEVASLTNLPVANGTLAAAVYWYSIITTPLEELSAVWSELERVLRTSGSVLIAFQSGQNDKVETPDAFGSSATLTLYRHSVDAVIESLHAAGFGVRADIRRQPELLHEDGSQAFLMVGRAN